MKTHSLAFRALVTARRSCVPGPARKSPGFGAILPICLSANAAFVRAAYGSALHIVPAGGEAAVTLCGRAVNAQYGTLTERSAKASAVCPDCARLAAKRHLLFDGATESKTEASVYMPGAERKV